MATGALTALAARIAAHLCGPHEALRVTLLQLLAEGQPVSLGLLADHVGWPVENVAAVIHSCSDTERDQAGNIVGWGLSLLPTAHQFRLGERTLFTWCALDTLMYPAMLGQAAHIHSICPVTGKAVRLLAQPTGVTNLQPAGAVVSVALPDEASSTCARDAFCAHSYYFTSHDVAQGWQTTRPATRLLAVADAAIVAYTIATERVRRARRLEKVPCVRHD